MSEVARPRRGAPLKGEAGARERILATADALFYREGIHATGVDTVAEGSGVSKTSLCRVSRSEDELTAACASERDRSFWAWRDRVAQRQARGPRAVLEALLSGIAELIGHPAYRGCPFLNLATELPDPDHPGRAVAAGNKAEMRKRLAAIVTRLGAPDPGRVASQLTPLINGRGSDATISSQQNLICMHEQASSSGASPGKMPGKTGNGTGRRYGELLTMRQLID